MAWGTVIMAIAACSLANHVSCQLQVNDGANLQIVVPDSFINAEIKKALPEIIKKINEYPKVTCCYDDVGASHVHLNMQGINGTAPAVTAEVTSSTSGIAVAGTAEVRAVGSYRLCLHDDPFSKHACSTLFSCKGNFEIIANMAFSMKMEVTGENVTVVTPSLKVTKLTANICGKFKDELDKNLAKIESSAAKALSELGPTVSKALKAFLKNKTESLGGETVKADIAPGTQAITGGIAVRAIISFTNKTSGVKAPWPLRSQLPLATVANKTVSVYLADSVLSNVFYPFYKSGLFQKGLNKSSHGVEYDLYFNATSNGPQLLFNSSHEAIQSYVEMFGTSSKGEVHAKFQLHAGFQLSVTVAVAGNRTVDTILKLDSDFVISNISQECDEACQELLDGIQTEVKLAIPLINAALAKEIPKFPLPKGVDISSIVIGYGPGYMKMSITPETSEVAAHLLENMMNGLSFADLLAEPAIKCPAIQGAKPDGCI